MSVEIAGLGNAIMDALVIVEDGDALIDELGLIRGTMHAVNDTEWHEAYDRVKHLGVTLDSGGSCANTIATAGRLGAHVAYRGQVGGDNLGRVYAERMREATGSDFLRVAPDGATGKCLSIISKEDAERTMLTDLGASVQMPELGAFGEVLDGAAIAHFTGYTLLPGPMREVVLGAMRRAKDAGARISLDVADPFVVTTIKDFLWQVIDELTDIVFLNAEEARAITDQAPEHAVDTVASHAKVETVVVKLGARGSMIRHAGASHEVGIDKVQAIDTTGAGDAYAGGFLYGMVRGWSPEHAGRLGSSVAAATVAQLGAVVRDDARLAELVKRCAP